MRYLIPLLLLLPTSGRACSCYFTEHFCEYAANFYDWVGEETCVVRAELNAFRLAAGGRAPLFDIEIKEVIAGTSVAPGQRYSLLGQDGGNCNGPIMSLTEGKEYVIIFVNRDGYSSAYGTVDLSGNRYPVRDFPGCGPAALAIEGRDVRGKIAPGLSTTRLTALRDRLAECIDPEFIEEAGTPGPKRILASVYPNPADVSFTVELEEASPIYSADLYDISGRRISHEDLGGLAISKHVVNVNQLPAGVYVLIMETDGIRIKKRIVVR